MRVWMVTFSDGVEIVVRELSRPAAKRAAIRSRAIAMRRAGRNDAGVKVIKVERLGPGPRFAPGAFNEGGQTCHALSQSGASSRLSGPKQSIAPAGL